MFIGLLAASAACPAAQERDEKARQKFVTAATLACLALESMKDTPVRCVLQQAEDGPILMVSFEDGSKAQRYAPLVVSLVGVQLCELTRADRAAASLALVDSQLNRATVYSCEERSFTGWIQLS
jgi:hypothetical protein